MIEEKNDYWKYLYNMFIMTKPDEEAKRLADWYSTEEHNNI